MSYTTIYRNALIPVLERLDMARADRAIEWLREARDAGATIYTCGNGGSAATASHFATDLVKGASYGRSERFRVLALTDSLPTVSAYANDVSYAAVFVEQLKNFARPGDLLVAISGSGNSANVVEAARYARTVGCRVLTLTGRDGGALAPLADLDLRVPHPHMGLIEDAHMILCHMLAYWFMDNARFPQTTPGREP